MSESFTKVVLFTDRDGRARFREEVLPLEEGTPQARLSALFASGGYQLRRSGCSSSAGRWRSACRTAAAACSGPVSISSPTTPCRQARASTQRSTGTGAVRQETSLW